MEGKAPKKRSYSTILEDPVNKFVKEALSKFIQYCRGKNYTPKYMRGDLNETVERLNKLEGKDGDKWDKFKWLIVTGLVTLILGYLAVSVGLK